METKQNNIKKSYGKVEVAMILERNQYSKVGVDQVQLKQIVTKIYPSTVVKTALFDENEFSVADGKAYSTDRRALMDIPQGKTIEQVQERLNQYPDACIYQRVSNNVMDVLSESQVQAVKAGIQTLGFFESKLLVRDKDQNQITDGQGNLLTVYRQNFFSTTFEEDKNFVTTSESVDDFNLVGEKPATSGIDLGQLVNGKEVAKSF